MKNGCSTQINCTNQIGGQIVLKTIRLGDATDHGGIVTEPIPHTNLNGKPMAGKGNLVMYP
jgi:uncharacterized Zn-binding protein involved in type VI secretion